MEESVKRCRGFSDAREDLISKLPDALISQVLFYLPTKEAVSTSVLSSRWKSVWLLIPELDLNSSAFPSNNAFVGFIDKFIDFSKIENSCLHKLKLSIRKEHENDNKSCVTRWIGFVATHKLKHLDVECLLWKKKCLEVMPLTLYITQTLFYLRLHRVLLGNVESISLPCLKTMHLEQNVYANETCLEFFISSCPVLEDLSIVRKHRRGFHGYYSLDFGVLIDAPRLKYLKIGDDISRSKIVSNMDSLAKIEIVGLFYIERAFHYKVARNFFIGISRVRDMIISDRAMWFMSFYFLREESTPQFCNLSSLEVKISWSRGINLSMFLDNSPNLKSMVLVIYRKNLEKSVSFSSVPQCLLSSLEFVEIKISRFGIISLGIGIARFFVENSVVLKKLVVHSSRPMRKKSLVAFENLLALPRRSSMCQIISVVDAGSCGGENERCSLAADDAYLLEPSGR
ncbi:F-box domain [Arabidopsis suecica]|uniref:F-box domain n=1 Tax=Arabidopsis suecica TaxID=45249 RepID=A0A8T2DRP5_ARASU|nr:F-box domain [Arabidopsis suecica]